MFYLNYRTLKWQQYIKFYTHFARFNLATDIRMPGTRWTIKVNTFSAEKCNENAMYKLTWCLMLCICLLYISLCHKVYTDGLSHISIHCCARRSIWAAATLFIPSWVIWRLAFHEWRRSRNCCHWALPNVRCIVLEMYTLRAAWSMRALTSFVFRTAHTDQMYKRE